MLELVTKLTHLLRPRRRLSHLEYLFATQAEVSERVSILTKRPSDSTSLAASIAVLSYAGRRAARLRDAINLAKKRMKGRWSNELRQQIHSEFDHLFVETAALCFYAAMNKFWDEDESEFWVEDDSRDVEYLETLRNALAVADDIISDSCPAISSGYLAQEVAFLCESQGGKPQPVEKFIASVLQWSLPATETSDSPFSAKQIISGFCLMAVKEVSPKELDAVCRFVEAQAVA
jgi:hypothetical protein